MEIVREGAMCTKMLPSDAIWLNDLASYVFEKSRDDQGFVSSRLIAPLVAISTIALAIIQVPIYVVKSLLDVTIAIVNLNRNDQLSQGVTDFINAAGCFTYSLLTILFVATSIISPSWSFAYHEPAETKPKLSEDAQKLKEVNKANETKDAEITKLGATIAQLRAQLAALPAGEGAGVDPSAAQIAALEQTISQLRAELAKPQDRTEIEAAQAALALAEERIITIQEEFRREKLALDGQIAQHEQTITDLRAQLRAPQVPSEIERLESQLREAEVKLTELRSQNTEQKAAIDFAAQEKECLTGQIATLEARIANLTATSGGAAAEDVEVTTLKEKVLELQERLRIKEEASCLKEREQSGQLEQLQASLALAQEQVGGIVEALQKREKERYAPGTEIHSFVINDVKFEVVCNRENPNSVVQCDRLIALVRKFEAQDPRNTFAILEMFTPVEAKLADRWVIDLSKEINEHKIPDISRTDEGATAASVEEQARGIWATLTDQVNLWKEEHDPTKLVKYDCYMQEMNKKCMRLFPDGWNADFDDSELSKDMNQMRIYLRYATFPELFKDARARYQGFSALLNKVCLLLQNVTVEHAQKESIRTIVNQIVLTRWMDVSLDGYLGGLLEHVRKAFHAENGTEIDQAPFRLGDFADRLIHINNHEVKLAPLHVKKATADLAGQKLSGELGGEDFTGKKNTPGIRSIETFQDSDGTTQRVRYVRHGCPTSGGILSGAWGALGRFVRIGQGDSGERVTPNFEQFLTALNEKRAAAFITTHQQFDGGAENTRVTAVMGLQQRHENCAVLVQPIGQGSLGKKKGLYAGAKSFDELKQAILENFFEGDEGDRKRCQLPAFIKEQTAVDYRAVTAKMIDEVHRLFFNDGDDFANLEVWQQFLLIFYSFQRKDLMFRFQEACGKTVEYTTTFCKDFLDRGGIVALTDASIQAMLTDQFHEHEWMEGQVRHVVGPPLLVKRQEMIPEKLAIYRPLHERLARIYQESARLDALKEYRFAEKWSVIRHELARVDGQNALPDIGQITTLEEMKERFRWMQEAGRSKPTTIRALRLFTHSKDKCATDEFLDSRVTYNQEELTVKALLGRLNEAGDLVKVENLHKCLTLAMNGVMDEGRGEMRARMDRPDQGLALTREENLHFVITTTEDNWNIQMRHHCNYVATVDISAGNGSRFETEHVKEGHQFARIQTSLGVDFNVAKNEFTKAGSFTWKVQEIF